MPATTAHGKVAAGQPAVDGAQNSTPCFDRCRCSPSAQVFCAHGLKTILISQVGGSDVNVS